MIDPNLGFELKALQHQLDRVGQNAGETVRVLEFELLVGRQVKGKLTAKARALHVGENDLLRALALDGVTDFDADIGAGEELRRVATDDAEGGDIGDKEEAFANVFEGAAVETEGIFGRSQGFGDSQGEPRGLVKVAGEVIEAIAQCLTRQIKVGLVTEINRRVEMRETVKFREINFVATQINI